MAFNFTGKRDVYLEIADRYAGFISLGVLREGEKLPSVRTAAGELGVNPNTVQKAYQHLEEQGLICSVPKKGVYVINRGGRQDNPKEIAVEAVTALKAQGVGKETLLQALEEVYGL